MHLSPEILYGKVLGIIGMGEKGVALAERAKYLGMKIIYHDISTGTTTNTGVAGSGLLQHGVSVSGNIIVFMTGEFIRYYNISTQTTTNTTAIGHLPSVSGNIIAFDTSETWVSQDLNNDGDTEDIVIRYYNISTGITTNTGVAGRWSWVSGNIIAFETYEPWVNQDLNGDGDKEDFIMRYYDISTGTTTNTGAVCAFPHIDKWIITFVTLESLIGQDLNNDGDTQDVIIRYYDIRPPTPPIIPAWIDINPDTLNLKSNGEWVTAYVTLPEGYLVEDIDVTTVEMSYNDFVSAAEWGDILDGVLMVKFDRTALRDYLGEVDVDDGDKFYDISLTVRGTVAGTPFEGSDTISVKRK